MPSFDVVSELQLFEVKHAVQNTEKRLPPVLILKAVILKSN